MPKISAKIGCWYQAAEGQLFEVVAVDGEDGIDIQYFDGEVDELDYETWMSLSVTEVSAPEDWSGAFDVDGDVTDAVTSPEDRIGLLHAFEMGD